MGGATYIYVAYPRPCGNETETYCAPSRGYPCATSVLRTMRCPCRVFISVPCVCGVVRAEFRDLESGWLGS
jgi:hypothetical protein